MIEELRLERPVLGGHDIGSLVAQAVARQRPDLVRALVLAPPLPGIGERILTAAAQQEFWYLPFHRLPLADELIDGRPEAVRSYLRHFLTHWSGPDFTVTDDHVDHLVAVSAEPGAFSASISNHRVGAGGLGRVGVVAEPVPQPAQRIAVQTTVLWPDHDPLFPPDARVETVDQIAGQEVGGVDVHHLVGDDHAVVLLSDGAGVAAAAVFDGGDVSGPP